MDAAVTPPKANPPAAPKSRIRARNEARLLDAAQEAFAEFGFHGATVDQIAALAGMSKPNLHYYFKRKRDLYLAVMQRTLDLWLEPFQELDPAGDPAVELSRYIARKLELSYDNPQASRVFANEILQGAPLLHEYLEGELRQMVRRKARVIRQWIKAGKLADTDPYHLIFLIWAATQHYADFAPQVRAVMGKRQLTRRDFKDIEKSMCRLLLNGLLPRAD